MAHIWRDNDARLIGMDRVNGKMHSMETPITTPRAALDGPVLGKLEYDLSRLRAELLKYEQDHQKALERVHPTHRPSARNLLHYMALRRNDIRDLQARLAHVGLSSLGRSEAHVLVTIDRVLGMLALARGGLLSGDGSDAAVGFRQGERLLSMNAARLLGPGRAHRTVRIVVTMPTQAASDRKLVKKMLSAGMDCARINCAHDEENTWNGMIENIIRAREELDQDCKILMDLGGPKLRTGAISGGATRIRLRIGSRLALVPEERIRHKERDRKHDDQTPEIGCSVPEVFRDVQPGSSVWFNDGKIGGVVETAGEDKLLIRVTHTREKGRKLRPERGINFPDSALELPAMTPGDLQDLKFISQHADAVALSFTQTELDVLTLQDALAGLNEDLAVVLKIETRSGFENLPRLLLAGMRSPSCGVMIARGDLAVESGFERLAEVQEEILWVSEAAHVPTIWATQVLESLAKKGTLTRAEITDAAMSGRAEAVLLNKGPYVLQAIKVLDDVLGRMQAHQAKKRSLLRPLSISKNL